MSDIPTGTNSQFRPRLDHQWERTVHCGLPGNTLILFVLGWNLWGDAVRRDGSQNCMMQEALRVQKVDQPKIRRDGYFVLKFIPVHGTWNAGAWCNGSTPDFESVDLGSNPSAPAFFPDICIRQGVIA